jgi:hypothetical protein
MAIVLTDSVKASAMQPKQFSLRWLIGMVGVAACYLGLGQFIDWLATAIAITCLPLFLMMPRPSTRPKIACFWFCFVSIQAGWICCVSIWHTDGEVMAMGGVLALVIISTACILLLVHNSARAAATVSIIFFVLFAPVIVRQSILLLRLRSLQSDVAALAVYVERHRTTTGAYPASIPEYDVDEDIPYQRIAYWPDLEQDGYVITYKLYDGDNTNREYGPKGGWYYYPD